MTTTTKCVHLHLSIASDYVVVCCALIMQLSLSLPLYLLFVVYNHIN